MVPLPPLMVLIMKLPLSRYMLLLALPLLAACSSEKDEPPLEALDPPATLMEDEQSAQSEDGVKTTRLDDEGNILSDEIVSEEADGAYAPAEGDMESLPAQGTTVYFGYDSTDISSQYMGIIQKVADRLLGNASATVRLEGHTDERGSRTYNLALGERRAQSVLDVLLEKNVLSEQVDWVSYGEEIPAVTGQGEEVWRQNRRVEMILDE